MNRFQNPTNSLRASLLEYSLTRPRGRYSVFPAGRAYYNQSRQLYRAARRAAIRRHNRIRALLRRRLPSEVVDIIRPRRLRPYIVPRL